MRVCHLACKRRGTHSKRLLPVPTWSHGLPEVRRGGVHHSAISARAISCRYVFLEQELARRRGDTTLVDSVTDSLILWALEGTDPDAKLYMSRSDILERIGREIPATRQVVDPRLDSRLRFLASKNHPDGRQVRWYKQDDLFVLPFETRQRIETENRSDELSA